MSLDGWVTRGTSISSIGTVIFFQTIFRDSWRPTQRHGEANEQLDLSPALARTKRPWKFSGLRCSTRMRSEARSRVLDSRAPCVGVGASATDPVALYLLTLAPSSRRTMRQALDVVAGIAAPVSTSASFTWASLDYPTVVRIRASLALRYSPSTANRALAGLRGALRQAMLTGQIGAEQFARCCSVRAVRGNATQAGRSISMPEIKAVMSACEGADAFSVRDTAMISLLFGCGLRRAELVGLDRDHYDGDGNKLRVLGKGSRERIVFVNSSVAVALDRWLAIRGHRPGPLFVRVTQDGRLAAKRLSTQAVYRLTARVARKASITRPSPHDFRRTFVSELLDRGADLAVVQRLVGHASPTTTARYDRRGEHAQRRAVELLAIPTVAA